MNLQSNLLKNYRQNFPNDSYAKISQKTGIQVTRVFRIFNGSEMKLSEYLTLQKQCFCKSESLVYELLSKNLEKSFRLLDGEQLIKLLHFMEDLIDQYQIRNTSIFEK